MPFEREQQQVLATIKKAGNLQKGRIKTYKADPMGGGTVLVLNIEIYFAQVAYNGRDFADPSLANGLFKIIVPAINDDGVNNNDLKKLITNKSAKFVYPDGREVGVINTRITMPDGVTPILVRMYLGG